MKNTLALISLALTILISSCQDNSGYQITGNLSGFPDSTMVFLENLATGEVFDSTIVINNNFQLRGQLQDEPEKIWLRATVDNKFIYANLLIGNEEVEVKGDISDFPFYVTVTGSKTQDNENSLQDLTKSYDFKRDSLVHKYFELSPQEQDEKGKDIWDEIKIIDAAVLALRTEYMKSNINTYTGVINLGYLKKELPKDTVQALYNKISDKIKMSKYAKVVEVYLNEKISEIGDPYHNFKALNRDGDTIQFSSLIGKYILLDFTSAYCGPCVQSVEELKLIDQTYSDSLTIVSFSVDAKRDTWLESLDKDNPTWMSLWDGEGRYSETYIKYGVNALPTFFLIDPQGKILEKWSGYGKGSLEEKLSRFK